ncbi:Small ubiquitin-related modifier [Lachnellula hyalina]|uniref:Small ubiquitin-related modifier n=1 Tax=Lachnellula hyalina TaxID=1316788 RepID=A0A8H8R6A9_9HELO|nr:Small ubiquitin-related modifier [Lachnellula hyalina]TVY29388.1 Small ubiquitin-related modifier [Lachnellula hyalina]
MGSLEPFAFWIRYSPLDTVYLPTLRPHARIPPPPETGGSKNPKMSENGSPVQEKPEKPEALNIKVRDQDGNEMVFRIKGHTRMQKVIDAYCKAGGIDPHSRRFTIEGHRIQNQDTPTSLEMEDEDIVEVFVEQQGGVLLR